MATKFLLILSVFAIFIPMLSRAKAPTTRNASDKPNGFFKVYPIGKIQKRGSVTTIEINKKYQDALLGLDGFSHVWVFWWFDRNDTLEKRGIMRVRPRGDSRNPLTGVFATRSPVRPNLIALTACRILSVKDNLIRIDKIDALPGSPIVDLKPYMPASDSVPDVEIPDWVNR